MHRWADKIPKEAFFYAMILTLTLVRVSTATVRPCLPDFDCNAYIQMAQTLVYDPTLLGHQAMRILPSFLAGELHWLGFSLEMAFRLLSGAAYVLFGGLLFWSFRRFDLKPWVAFSFSLLCLAPHYAIKYPLQLVYQTCDMMTYPLSLLMIVCSLKNKEKSLFIFSLLGILTKQTLWVLSVFSFAYLFMQSKNQSARQKRCVFFLIALLGVQWGLQHYYHASTNLLHHIQPNEQFYSFENIKTFMIESQWFELGIPIVPFLLLWPKTMVRLLVRYWHLTLYMAVVIGQPILTYHFTGNNFPRLALQGVWWLLWIAALASQKRKLSMVEIGVLAWYSLGIYCFWKVPERLIWVAAVSVLWGIIHLKKRWWNKTERYKITVQYP